MGILKKTYIQDGKKIEEEISIDNAVDALQDSILEKSKFIKKLDKDIAKNCSEMAVLSFDELIIEFECHFKSLAVFSGRKNHEHFSKVEIAFNHFLKDKLPYFIALFKGNLNENEDKT